MQDNQQLIDELNRFLKGRYMGMHQYERLIEHAKNAQLKEWLQSFQAQAEEEAHKVADRIRQLGGEPVDDIGMMGEIQVWMQKLKGTPESTEDILQDAIIGENKYGIHLSHRMVAGDLDEESTRLVDSIFEADQKRIDRMKQWLESNKIVGSK